MKWEYIVMDDLIGDWNQNERLNELGADGWEMCGFGIDQLNHSHSVFKRPKP